MKQDPISFAAQKGLADVAPLDFTKPQTLADQLMARAQVARGMQAQYGSPLKSLTNEEAIALGRLMRDGGVTEKRQILGALSQALPDRDVYMATMGQIAPDDPVTAMAGAVARRGDGSAIGTTKGRLLSDLILRGQGLLAPNRKEDGKPSGGTLIKMPADKDLDTAFASYEGNAFAGKEQARNAYVQSAKAVYAALSSDEGDQTGVLNSGRWQTAMRLATGGIEKHNGRSIVLPYGADYSDFRRGLDERAKTLIDSKRLDDQMTVARLRNLPLENVGDGRYVFRAGDGVLAGKDGRPVVIDFNR